MARTVIVFRDTMIEREKLAASQADASRAQAQRSDDDCAHHRAIQAFGRKRAGQAARGLA